MSVLIQICLLAVICVATGADQLPLVRSDAVQVEEFRNGYAFFDESRICTSTQLVERLSCDFNGVARGAEADFFARLLPVCNSGEKNAAWTNMPYYSYQFSRDDQNVKEGQAAVVSNCLKNTFPSSLISPTQATATLRTGIYPGTDNGELFHVSFWCKFGSTPKVAGKDDPNRFFLQLALHRQGRSNALIDGAGLPSRNLWGSTAEDYSSIQANKWNQVVLTFAEFEQFSLMFFAHHNDGCSRAKLNLIHIDSVVVKKVKTMKCPSTTL